MPCTQTLSGLARDCAANMGGIKVAWIGNYADIAGVTVTDAQISAIELATGAAKLKKYNFRPESSQFTSTLNKDNAAGSSYVGTDIALVFAHMDTTKRIEMNALSLGELVVIVKDNNDALWFFGKDAPVVSSTGDAQSGTAFADANRYSITLHDSAKEWPFGIDPAALTDSIVDEL